MAREKLILTYQDYLKMPDDRTRKEILGGDLYVTPAPTPAHQRVVVRLASLLSTHVEHHGPGEVFVSPIDVVLSQTDVVQPDIVFVVGANTHIIGEAAVQGPPDLVIEVLSPSTVKLDRGRKMGLYARSGVAEYWIVDPDNRSVEVYRLEGSAYRLELRAHEGDMIRSDLFPGLVISPAGLWR
ncbi:MAG: hypothetical protein A2Z07_05025 [Armatimonadetes bacterium RBG_16_67_12]|nr:MAG: hypothetical protein A2Z07_05025 [Armatimonadetes bacterium RBG_16_67_12]